MPPVDDSVDVIARALFRAHDDATRTGREPSNAFDEADECEWKEGWRSAARTAIALGAHPPSSARARLQRLFDPTNFLNSGLTMQEYVRLGMAEKMAASWTNQDRDERRRRLKAVVRLSAELARIREINNFSTGIAEMAIEGVITGDRTAVEDVNTLLTFEDEGPELRRMYAPLYANFREILLQTMRAEKERPA